MIDYPEHLNSKQDYLNMLSFDKGETVRRLKSLLETRFYWVLVKELDDGEGGVEDESHRVYVSQDFPFDLEGDFVEKRYQYELQESEYAPLFRLGFSVEEVEQLIRENKE
ncbi:hypothetical protein [Bartonella sp. ML69XJBT]|uniref:hypothetical protein n=1 Tax=Bartonella sp. ML69XJBT TaxID=3019092 RepID=UPI00235F51BD|nr:hypothetical protein [Bartonella sp. ML69XJBT]